MRHVSDSITMLEKHLLCTFTQALMPCVGDSYSIHAWSRTWTNVNSIQFQIYTQIVWRLGMAKNEP